MKWWKENAGWTSAFVAVLLVAVGWLSGLFEHVVEIEAKPAIQKEIYLHELEVEPRLQKIETTSTYNKEEIQKIQDKLDDSLVIQQKILDKVSE